MQNMRGFLSLLLWFNLPAVLSDINSMYGDEDFCFNRSFLATTLLQNIGCRLMDGLIGAPHPYLNHLLEMSKLSTPRSRSILPVDPIPTSGAPFQSNCLMESPHDSGKVFGEGFFNHEEMMKDPNGFGSRSHQGAPVLQ